MIGNSVVDNSQLEQVRQGMTVVDADGRRLGKVKRLRTAEPLAVGAGVSTGFEFEDANLQGVDRYVSGDRISDVHDDTVYLRPAAQGQLAPEAAMLRTQVGTPRYRVRGDTGLSRKRVAMAAGGGLTLASIVGGVGIWRYRQRQRRLDARARRWVASVGRDLSWQDPRSVGGMGIGTALVLTLLMRMLLTRRRSAMSPPPVLEEAAGQLTAVRGRIRPPTLLGALGALLVLGFLVSRRRRGGHTPTYIGTPGVESASGRDRIRTGELPAHMGIEQGLRE